MPIYLKYLITAAIVVAVSEFAKRSDKLGALVSALPMVTILVMIWLFVEIKSAEQTAKIANHAFYTFWYVIPTLPMFLVMSSMLKKGAGFWLSLGVYVVGTLVLFLLLHVILRRFGMGLI